MALKLTPRLAMVASLTNGGGVLADIGTDHAYLPAALVLEGRVASAIACDIGRLPLENAAETLRRFGLYERISLRQSDGLDALKADEVDEIVIAGMGGTLMVNILSRAPWLRDSSKHLVLQPQTHSEDVRRWLCENGFEILCEKAVTEGRHVYGAMSASYTGSTDKYPDGYFYTGKMPRDTDADAAKYVQNTLSRLKKKACALRESGSDEKTLCSLEKIIAAIEGGAKF